MREMDNFLKSLMNGSLAEKLGGAQVAVNPSNLSVDAINIEGATEIVVVHSEASNDEINIDVKSGAKLSLVEIFASTSKVKVNISVAQDAACNITTFDLAGGDVDYTVSLNGRGGECVFNSLQLTTKSDNSKIDCCIRHIASDCTSRSLSKAIASGDSTIVFKGMVYVAQAAQRTISEQNSKNIQLSPTAHIISEPQLEIYADDVKCSHGATVGQMNSDAILYMRQRGLSEELAQKLQLEGFAEDIVSRCSISGLIDQLEVFVQERLHKI